MSEMTLTVGLFLRREFRNYLKEAHWHHQVADWTEIKGLLGSQFLIRGASSQVIDDIGGWLQRLQSQR